MGYKDKYKNMGRSNLTFLNANGDGEQTHQEILVAIEKDKQDKIKALLLVDKDYNAKRSAIIAEADAKVKAENRRYDLEKLFGKVSGTLTTTQGILSSLGINPPAQPKDAPIGGKDSYKPVEDSKDYTWWFVGGAVALGVIGFVIYKAKK